MRDRRPVVLVESKSRKTQKGPCMALARVAAGAVLEGGEGAHPGEMCGAAWWAMAEPLQGAGGYRCL